MIRRRQPAGPASIHHFSQNHHHVLHCHSILPAGPSFCRGLVGRPAGCGLRHRPEPAPEPVAPHHQRLWPKRPPPPPTPADLRGLCPALAGQAFRNDVLAAEKLARQMDPNALILKLANPRDQPSDWPQATLENFELVMTKMAEVACRKTG